MTGTPKDPGPNADRARLPATGGTSADEFSGLAFQFAISVIVFAFVGQWADRKLGTAPWLLIIGVFAGAGLSFYNMYRKLLAVQARDDAARAARPDGHS